MIIERSAIEHGWLRRPELASACYDTWEMPDGRLYQCARGRMPIIATHYAAAHRDGAEDRLA